MDTFMDHDQLIKLLHIVFAISAFAFLIIRALPILSQRDWQQKSTTSNKILIGAQHLSYSIIVLSGLWLLWASKVEIQTWFYAKIILFFVILSATAKAFTRKKEILLVQRQAGLVIAIIAFFALFGLIMLKPQFG